MNLSLAGQGVFLSQHGLGAVLQDIGVAGISPVEILGDVAPAVQALLPHLETEGIATQALAAALDGIGGLRTEIETKLTLLKLQAGLEGIPDPEAYRRAANEAVIANGGFKPSVLLPSPQAEDLLRYARAREEAAAKQRWATPYSRKYRERGKIAEGRQAEIFLVEELDAQRNPTGREYIARKLKSADDLGRLYDYYRSLMNLDHPGIVKGHDLIAEKDERGKSQLILILEVVPGLSLSEHLERKRHFTEEQIWEIYRQLMDAMKHAWSRRIIHRDLKPSNVMVDVDAAGKVHVKILDFGLAKFAGEDSRGSSIGKGTLFYWAPEQFTGGKVTIATDLHALGLVLLDLLRGSVRDATIEDESPEHTIAKLKERGFDTSLLTLIQTLCDPDPEVRLSVLGDEGTSLVPMTSGQMEAIGNKIGELVRVRRMQWYQQNNLMGTMSALGTSGIGMSAVGFLANDLGLAIIGALFPAATVVLGSLFVYGDYRFSNGFIFPSKKHPLTQFLSAPRFITGALMSGFATLTGFATLLGLAGVSLLPFGTLANALATLLLALGARAVTKKGEPERIAEEERKKLSALNEPTKLEMIAELHPDAKVRLLAARALAQWKSG